MIGKDIGGRGLRKISGDWESEDAHIHISYTRDF